MDLTNDEEVSSWANNNILKAFSVCCKVSSVRCIGSHYFHRWKLCMKAVTYSVKEINVLILSI